MRQSYVAATAAASSAHGLWSTGSCRQLSAAAGGSIAVAGRSVSWREAHHAAGGLLHIQTQNRESDTVTEALRLALATVTDTEQVSDGLHVSHRQMLLVGL